MFTNHSQITVFTSKKVGRETLWIKTFLEDVNFHGSDLLLVGDKEVTPSDEYIIRIPNSVLQKNHYVDNRTWKSLPLEEASDFFTLQKGDYAVKGFVDDDIFSSADIVKNYDAMQILSVTENLNASEFSKHVKVVVK